MMLTEKRTIDNRIGNYVLMDNHHARSGINPFLTTNLTFLK